MKNREQPGLFPGALEMMVLSSRSRS